MKKISLLFVALVSLLFIFTGIGLSQEPEGQTLADYEGMVEADILWLWGEVSSLDTQNKTLLVKYFDYETDQEKEMVVATDSKTIYENIKSFDEIKPQDTVSIDYIVSPEGKGIAKNISVEKPEGEGVPQSSSVPEMQPKPAAQDETMSGLPEAAPPAAKKT
jgi:hypothetical protein